MKTRQHRRNAAFTLLEIMLVVMIIALLAGSAIHLMRGNVDDTRIVVAQGDITNLQTQLQMYEVVNGNYPSTEQGLQALVERPSGDPQPRKWRPLLTKPAIDPWGNAYLIRNPATLSKDRIDVYSAGPDRQPNTADDIGNW